MTDENFSLQKFVETIAAAMPGDWTAISHYNWSAYALREDGLEIAFRLDGKDRVEVSPSVPMKDGGGMSLRSWGVIPYSAAEPSTTFRRDRSPGAIAAQVMRKVVEPYAPLYVDIIHRKAIMADQRTGTAATVVALEKILGAKSFTGDGCGRDKTGSENICCGRAVTIRPKHSPGEFHVNPSGHIEFKASLTDEQAIAVARLIATWEA